MTAPSRRRWNDVSAKEVFILFGVILIAYVFWMNVWEYVYGPLESIFP